MIYDRFLELKAKLDTQQFKKLWYLESFDKRQGSLLMAKMPHYNEYLINKEQVLKDRVGRPVKLLFMYEEPLLKPKQHYHLFRQYNYLKHKFKVLINKTTNFEESNLKFVVFKLEQYYEQLSKLKHLLVCANGRLVINIIKKMHVGDQEIGISDGIVGLNVAVDYYDFRKGIQFSTYAYYVIKDLIRKGKVNKITMLTNLEQEDHETIWQELVTTDGEDVCDNDQTRIVNECLRRVTQREREIISYSFGLNGKSKLSAEEIAKKCNICAQRVFQIKKAGIDRIKRHGVPI
jgi:RNA polymerase sigma factor (sigma-70 family)